MKLHYNTDIIGMLSLSAHSRKLIRNLDSTFGTYEETIASSLSFPRTTIDVIFRKYVRYTCNMGDFLHDFILSTALVSIKNTKKEYKTIQRNEKREERGRHEHTFV